MSQPVLVTAYLANFAPAPSSLLLDRRPHALPAAEQETPAPYLLLALAKICALEPIDSLVKGMVTSRCALIALDVRGTDTPHIPIIVLDMRGNNASTNAP